MILKGRNGEKRARPERPVHVHLPRAGHAYRRQDS